MEIPEESTVTPHIRQWLDWLHRRKGMQLYSYSVVAIRQISRLRIEILRQKVKNRVLSSPVMHQISSKDHVGMWDQGFRHLVSRLWGDWHSLPRKVGAIFERALDLGQVDSGLMLAIYSFSWTLTWLALSQYLYLFQCCLHRPSVASVACTFSYPVFHDPVASLLQSNVFICWPFRFSVIWC